MTTFLRIIPFVLLSVSLFAACGGGDDATPTSTGRSPSPPPARPQPTATATAVQQETSGGAAAAGTSVTIVNEDIGGSGAYRFNPSDVTFKVGETVTFTLRAETEFHTFTVEDLDIDESLGAGETHPFTFTFDRPGTFNLVCLAHPDMTGTITVK